MKGIMKISIISGSQRPKSQSLKVASYLAERLKARGVVAGDPIDLGLAPLPFWDESAFSSEPSPLNDAWKPISAEFSSCDGFVVVVPEWHGMAPPALKNMLLLCTSELAHKPGLIVGISASAGGTYPMVELRLTGFKNNRICWIPDHLVIRGAKGVLNETPAKDEEAETAIENRCDFSLAMLVEYARALRTVRESEAFDLKTYPFGM
jgi:NAD(P)H-dependent FMN reductase